MANPFDQFDAAPNPFDRFGVARPARDPAVTAKFYAENPELSSDYKYKRPSILGSVGRQVAPPAMFLAGIPETLVSGVTGAAGTLADVATLSDPGTHNWAMAPLTPAGRYAQQELARVVQPVAEVTGEQYDKAFGTGPLAQTVKERGSQALDAVGTVLGGAGAAKTITKSALTPDASALVEAQKLGYVVPPRMAGSTVGGAVEGLANSAKTERVMSVKNQQVTNRLARRALGLDGASPITASEIASLRKKHNAAYEAISNTGRIVADQDFARSMFGVGGRTAQMVKDFPDAASKAVEKLRNSYMVPEFDAKSAVQATRVLRAEASKLLKAFDDPEKQALGHASREIADIFDAQLQRHADFIGKGSVAQQFRRARQELAKIHSVEDAWNETTGNVNALKLGKQLEKGAPLSGELKQIAEVARRYGKAVQDTDKLPNMGFEFADPALAGAAAAATAAAGGNPLFGGAAVFARPLARQALASGAYQATLRPEFGRGLGVLKRGAAGAGAVGAVSNAADQD